MQNRTWNVKSCPPTQKLQKKLNLEKGKLFDSRTFEAKQRNNFTLRDIQVLDS